MRTFGGKLTSGVAGTGIRATTSVRRPDKAGCSAGRCFQVCRQPWPLGPGLSPAFRPRDRPCCPHKAWLASAAASALARQTPLSAGTGRTRAPRSSASSAGTRPWKRRTAPATASCSSSTATSPTAASSSSTSTVSARPPRGRGRGAGVPGTGLPALTRSRSRARLPTVEGSLRRRLPAPPVTPFRSATSLSFHVAWLCFAVNSDLFQDKCE